MDHPTAGFTFEPDTPRHTDNPYPDYAWLREHAPLYHWPERDAILVSRAADLRDLFTDDRLSLDVRNWAHYSGELFAQPRFETWSRIDNAGLFRLPNEDHTRVRKLASAGLTPRAVRRMDQTIERTVNEILARLSGGEGELDVSDYAEAIPMTVISDILGIPEEHRPAFREFGLKVIQAVQPTQDIEVLGGYADAYTEGVAMLEQVIEARRAMAERPDDMLTDWIEANEDGQRLSNDELISLTTALITAGSDTTVHGTCYAVYTLLRHPEALAEIRADRSLLRGAIEESLRYDFFGKGGVTRFALEPFEWKGVQIRKGQIVMGMIGAAGHDRDEYEDPERFEIRRPYRANLTFGLGRHFCLGANLARSELMHAVEKLLLDHPEAQLLAEPTRDSSNPLMRAMSSLRVRLGPKAVQA